jgi:hypothetical protein
MSITLDNMTISDTWIDAPFGEKGSAPQPPSNIRVSGALPVTDLGADSILPHSPIALK